MATVTASAAVWTAGEDEWCGAAERRWRLHSGFLALLTALLRITAAASDRCSLDQMRFCSARWTKFKQVLKASLRKLRHMRCTQTRCTFLYPCLTSQAGTRRWLFYSSFLTSTGNKQTKKKMTPNIDHTNSVEIFSIIQGSVANN